MALPPGPKAHPLTQLFHFAYRPLAFLEESRAEHGDPFTLRFAGHGTYVAVSSPELVKQVFAAGPDQLRGGEANVVLEPIFGKSSVMLLDGAPHTRQRKLLMPPLHGERMRAYAQLMSEVTRARLAQMPVGRPFSLHPHTEAITLEVILRAVFGAETGPELEQLRRSLVALLVVPPTLFTFVPVRYVDFPLSPFRSFLAKRSAVDRVVRSLAVRRRSEGYEGKSDVLSLLLSARDEDGSPMTDDELSDQLITMLLAGHETSATALSWAVACILGDEQVSARLHDELEGARGANGELDPNAVPRLEYLDAAVKETLRPRPILPDVVRRVKAPITLGGHEIPTGVNLMMSIYLTHRRAETYPEPARFNPDRFLGAKIDPNAWFPFGGGVRRCVGMAFALYEMKVVLAQLLLGAKFRLASPSPVEAVRRGVTLSPTGGTRVVIESRRRVPNRESPQAV
jgi:cytochrome P450